MEGYNWYFKGKFGGARVLRRRVKREVKDIILFELDSTWGGVSKYC